MWTEAELHRVTAMRETHATAGTHQTYAIGEVVSGTLRAVQAYMRRVAERYRQLQEAHAVYEALDGLDDHTLHDLGFDRSELASVAAELGGIAERTRVRTLLEPRAGTIFRVTATSGCGRAA
jgi:hypothetical protein